MTGVRTATAAMFLSTLAVAHGAAAPPRVLADMSLEELADIEITSVSRHPESLSDAAASIYVITNEDIRRSGASTLPEALRLAPNLQVARVNGGQYAITARGFNNAIGNKLLVLIDGRSVYASYFSGVQWDQQDVMLEDVDRIEVISGPGGTLWGTNAVNGVINVVTRSSAQTQDGLVVIGGGNREANAAFRYGGVLASGGHFRVYAKSSTTQNTTTAAGATVLDGWQHTQAGFRADWAHPGGGFMLQGNVYSAQSDDRLALGPIVLGPVDVSGANLLGQWTHQYANGSDVRVQAYYDHSERIDAAIYSPKEDVLDLQFEHGISIGPHRLMWGGGYRVSHDDMTPGFFFGFVPASRTLNWSNVFAQSEIKLTGNTGLTLGARLERNPFTGTEVLPSARWSWKVSNDGLLWAAASRAVRAPSRLDVDLRLPANPPFLIAGGPDFVSEVANVYELGYRAQPLPHLSFSVTAFHQDWNRLRSGQVPPNAEVQNMIDGKTSGVEAWATWQAASNWRLMGGATTLRKDLRLQAASTDPVGVKNLGNDPNYQWTLRSAFNLSDSRQFDVSVRRVAALPDPVVPAYTAVDLRYGWRLSKQLELSIAVRDLLDAAHAEFGNAPDRSEIGRSALVQVRWSP
jgi:iron complex outermembrane receptor protein